MPYTLDNFTQQAPPALLAQAQSDLDHYQVQNLEKVGIEWLADVQDHPHRYAVAVAVGPRGELLATCGCGDSEHELCRHALAVVLGAVARGEEAAQSSSPRVAPRNTTHTAMRRLRAAVEGASQVQLAALLVTLAKGDKHLQNRILLELVDVGASPESYRDAVKGALSPRGGLNYLADEQTAKAAAVQLEPLLNRADQALSAGETDRAVDMALVVYAEIMAFFDRGGYSFPLDASIDRALQMIVRNLVRATPAMHTEAIRRIAELLNQYRRLGFWQSVRAAKRQLVDLVETPAERALVVEMLLPQSSQGDAKGAKHWDETINLDYLYMYRLIVRLDGAQAAHAFARQHIGHYLMRTQLIEVALEQGDNATARALAAEGLRLSEKFVDKPWLASEFRNYLLAIGEEQGEEHTELRRKHYLHDQSPENLAAYKAAMPPAQWPAARSALLSNAELHWRTKHSILYSESMWRELMDAFAACDDFYLYELAWNIKYEGAELAARFPAELAACTAQLINGFVQESNMSRSKYRQIAQILQMLCALGLETEAAAIAANLRTQYPKRPALLEEIKASSAS